MKYGGQVFVIETLKDFTVECSRKMINAGMEILEPAVRSSLENAIGKNLKHESRSTGSLLQSITVSNMFIRREDTFFKANIFFKAQGNKANWKEYGTERGQKPSFFVKRAVNVSRKRVETAMQQVLERELKD
jgi:hypothetical protein